MEIRYISLHPNFEDFGDEFSITFHDNANFICNYLAKRIRSYHIKTDGSYNLLWVCLTTGEDRCWTESVNALHTNIHFSMDNMKRYLQMKDKTERYEFYLSLLERGYRVAERLKPIPTDLLLSLHDEFRQNGYKNERLFKKKQIREYGIKVALYHVMTTTDYQLMLYVYNLRNELIGQGCIYKTLPDELIFVKTVRHLMIENGQLIITDFLDHPQFVCQLRDLSKGIVDAICVDESTKEDFPNENNKDKFERLIW